MQTMTEAVDPTLMRAKVRVGRTLRGKWQLDALLGVGGMAAVYAGTHRNGARAAIKILHAELAAHRHVRERFFREGRVANTVGHPGAVKVLDEDETEDGSVFLVMELLDGESLEARLERKGGKLDPDEVLATTDQLLDVLIAAHDKGIVHRDIKPENVLLTRDGQIRVLDFGIARLRELSSVSNATRDGSTIGTPAYMSPEHARGLWDEVDGRADVWAVGATMFTLLTGKPVHSGRTANDVLVSAVTQKAPRLITVMPELPLPVANLVDRALAFDRDQRWPSARAMQEALRLAYHSVQGAPITTHPRLTVPATVPDRTVPGAAVDFLAALTPAATTGPAATVIGQTGVPLTGHSVATGSGRNTIFVVGAVAGFTAVALAGLVFIALLVRGGPEQDPEPSVATFQPMGDELASAEAEDASAPAEPSIRVIGNPSVGGASEPDAATSPQSTDPAMLAGSKSQRTEPKPGTSPKLAPTGAHWKDSRR